MTVIHAADAAEAKRSSSTSYPMGSEVHRGASQTLDTIGSATSSSVRALHEPSATRCGRWTGARRARKSAVWEPHRMSCSAASMRSPRPAHSSRHRSAAASSAPTSAEPGGSSSSWDAEDRRRPRGGTAAHRGVRPPPRGCPCAGRLRRPSSVNKVLVINREFLARPHHRGARRRGPRLLAPEGDPHGHHRQAAERDVVLVEDAHVRPMMGIEVLEPVPARTSRTSSRTRTSSSTRRRSRSIRSARRWTRPTPTAGSTTSGTSSRAPRARATAPGRAAFERAQLETGGLLKIRTGRGVYHAETSARTSFARARPASSAACSSG